MKKIHKLFFLTFMASMLSSHYAISQDGTVMKGRIRDASDGAFLVGASLVDLGSGRGVASDTSGSYRFTVPTNEIQIRVSYLGYQSLDTSMVILGSALIDFFLIPQAIVYEEVKITSDVNKDYVSSVQMSEIRLNQEEIASLPAFLGESDPIRYLQLTPGVQSSTEGGVGFYVRGGGVDQNLVLYDDAVIYNPGHLLGFISVFNPDIVSGVSLIKSGIPARYGGRLSSVVRVNQYTGRSDSLRVKGQIGLVSSRISINRSFNKDRGSFVFSARRASIDLFVKPLVTSFLRNSAPYFQESNYNFYDFNGGISYRLGKKDFVSISSYYGKDKNQVTRSAIQGESSMEWGNALVTAWWNHLFSDKLSLGVSLSHSRYDFGFGGAQKEYTFGLVSAVRDYALKTRVNYHLSKHKFTFGIDLIDHRFTPNDIEVEAKNFTLNFLEFNQLYAYEGGIFAEDEIRLTERWSMALGMRWSVFNQVGPSKVYIYDEFSRIQDSVTYSDGESMVFYHHPEPRLSMRYQLNDNSSLKASYMHLAQYIHLATSATVSLPMDIWLPSSKQIEPQYGDQWSLGYFRTLFDGQFETSVEAYYKSTRNQLEFIRGVINNSLNMTMEDNLAVGDSRSYGAEFFVRKKSGALTGWIGYTLSKTERQFDQINDGNVYPSKFDRRHDLSVAGIYQINELWNVSAVFVYVSGNAFTMPVGRYIIQGNLVNEYGAANTFRMPSYHRMDLSATRSRETARGNISSWNFSIYNVYNRSNPYYIFFETTADLDNYKLDVQPEMVSIFPIIPSISWRFEF